MQKNAEKCVLGKRLSRRSLYSQRYVLCCYVTLHETAKKYPVGVLHPKMIDGQEQAFQTCLSFLAGVEKTKSPNKRHDSYGYKHIVESPAGRYDIPSAIPCYGGYIEEGTFILAALAAGFTMWGGP